MYEATKPCRLSGTSPWMSTASQLTKPTTAAATPRSASQTKSGIARKRRKNTVRRLRARSSRTTSRTGRCSMVAIGAFSRTGRVPDLPDYDRAMAVDRDAIERARELIGGRLHRTPMLSSRALGPNVYLKAELFQKTGSFKPRGMVNKVASLSKEEKARGIVTWSAGNAAQGAAFAAAEAGTPCTVFMWATANPIKVAATRGYGAEVDLTAGNPVEAHERLLAYVEETGRTFV